MQALSKLEQAVVKSILRQSLSQSEIFLDKETFEHWKGVYKDSMQMYYDTPVSDIAFSFLTNQTTSLRKMMTLGARHLFKEKTDFSLRTTNHFPGLTGSDLRSKFFQDLTDLTSCEYNLIGVHPSLFRAHFVSFKVGEKTDLDLLREYLTAESVESYLMPADLHDSF